MIHKRKAEVSQISLNRQHRILSKYNFKHALRIPEDVREGCGEFVQSHPYTAGFLNLVARGTDVFAVKRDAIDSLISAPHEGEKFTYSKIKLSTLKKIMVKDKLYLLENNPNYYILRLRFLIYEGKLNYPLMYKGVLPQYDDCGISCYYMPYYKEKNFFTPICYIDKFIEHKQLDGKMIYVGAKKDKHYVTLTYEIRFQNKIKPKKGFEDRYYVATNRNDVVKVSERNPSDFLDRVLLKAFQPTE